MKESGFLTFLTKFTHKSLFINETIFYSVDFVLVLSFQWPDPITVATVSVVIYNRSDNIPFY